MFGFNSLIKFIFSKTLHFKTGFITEVQWHFIFLV